MELLRGKTLIKKSGDDLQEVSAIEALKNVQIVGFYFSAHWCLPCRAFTPCLVNCYKDLRAKKKPFEIVFVSADESPELAKSYMKEAHGEWMSTVFEDSDLHDALTKAFGVVRIPQLIIVKKNGQIITPNGCRDVTEKGEEAFASWLEGKSAIISQEQVGNEDKLLGKISTGPPSKLEEPVHGSDFEICLDESDSYSPETDELSISLEKAGIKTQKTEKDTKKIILPTREVEKPEIPATSSGKKTKETSDKGAIPKTKKSQKENGSDISAASSKKMKLKPEVDKEDKAKMSMGEGGPSEMEKVEKGGKGEIRVKRKRKRHLKKKSVGTKAKSDTKKKPEDPKI